MAGGYASPPGDAIDQLIAAMRDLKTRITELERPTGTQTAKAVETLTALVNDLQQQVDDLLAIAVNTGDVNATGHVTAGTYMTATGVVTGVAGLSSVGAYGTDVSLMAGARQAVWQHNSGVYGYAPSTVAAKANLGPIAFTAEDVLAVSPQVFQYRGQLAIRDDPKNRYYDPDYVVPWEVGLMAEDLIKHNMACFVFFEEDGVTPKGINYDLFAAITSLIVAKDFDSRIRQLEER